MLRLKKVAAALTGAALLTGATHIALAATASADPQPGHGETIVPAQPYQGKNPDRGDWLGSYVVAGQQVWCVNFALKAPDSDQQYHDGDELRTKFDQAIPAQTKAEISYLLLRYSNTSDSAESAALAHLLHSWTAAPRNAGDLDPGNDYRHIAYNIDYHAQKLSEAAKADVTKLTADAERNRGPWKLGLAAPEGPQTIDQAGEWPITVTNSAGKGIGKVPVKLTLTDAKLADDVDPNTVVTPADGSPLKLKVVPTGPNPKVVADVTAPADEPRVRVPQGQLLRNDAERTPETASPEAAKVQQVVTTGGETQLSQNATTPARTAPGTVKIAKLDDKTKAGIAGVSLTLTAGNKTDPATNQDGSKLTGPDGKPVVLRTGADGTAAVPDLATPQDICVVEATPAPGYEDSFDAANPPSSCGSVKPGDTLALSLTNVANQVPSVIPAGDPGLPPNPPAAQPDGGSGPLALTGIVGVVIIGTGVGGVLWRRRVRAVRAEQ